MKQRLLVCITGWLLLCASCLAAAPEPSAEASPKRLSGKIYAFVVSGYYEAPDPKSPAAKLNEVFKATGDEFVAHLRKTIPREAMAEDIVRLEGAGATRKALEDILERIRKIPDNSLVIFYFCGHGFRQGEKPASAPGAADKRSTCLALAGCDPSGRIKNASDVSLSTSRIADAFDRTPNVNFMVFLDCCHAGMAVPFLPTSTTDPYNIQNRGFFMAASTRDQLSYNCDFTKAVLKVWKDGSFDKSETLHSVVAKVTNTMNEGKPTPLQIAQNIVGNDSLPLGIISADLCVFFLQLSPQPAPPQYFVTIDGPGGSATTQPSPATTMLLLTVPRKECTVTIKGPFKEWKQPVNFTGKPYYPIHIQLDGAWTKDTTTLAQQQAIEADYENLLVQARHQGLSLATVGINPIRNAKMSQPLLNTVPLVKTFLAGLDGDTKDELWKETDLVKAAGYLVRNENFPVTSEGKRLAVSLSNSGIGGEALISRFNYDCFGSIVNNPEVAARDLGFESPAVAKDNLFAFFASALRHALISGDETLIKTEPIRLVENLRAKPTVLSKTDLDRIRTLQTVAMQTYDKRAVSIPPEDQPIDLEIVKKASDYQSVIKTVGIFADSDYGSRMPPYQMTNSLVRKIDKGPQIQVTYGAYKK